MKNLLIAATLLLLMTGCVANPTQQPIPEPINLEWTIIGCDIWGAFTWEGQEDRPLWFKAPVGACQTGA